MDHVVRFDDVAKIILIIRLGELQHTLSIANLVGMYVMVDCVCA
jgi:hypothetical protein